MSVYQDKVIDKNVFERSFLPTVSTDELVWHRDKKDRLVEVVNGGGWFIQFDNQLPTPLKDGDSIFIQRETFHRIIKGSEKLQIKIVELNS